MPAAGIRDLRVIEAGTGQRHRGKKNECLPALKTPRAESYYK